MNIHEIYMLKLRIVPLILWTFMFAHRRKAVTVLHSKHGNIFDLNTYRTHQIAVYSSGLGGQLLQSSTTQSPPHPSHPVRLHFSFTFIRKDVTFSREAFDVPVITARITRSVNILFPKWQLKGSNCVPFISF